MTQNRRSILWNVAGEARLAAHDSSEGLFMSPSKPLLSSVTPTFEPDLQDMLPCACFPAECYSDGGGNRMPTPVCLLLDWPAARPLNSHGPRIPKSTWFVFLPPLFFFSHISRGLFARCIPGNDEGTLWGGLAFFFCLIYVSCTAALRSWLKQPRRRMALFCS